MTQSDQACSILVIEDDYDYLSNMELILRMEGFEVRTASDGASALELLRQRPADLILCDIMMPGMDGHAFLQLLSQEAMLAGVSFIFVTALAERADVRRGMSSGADDYLTKPFTAEELIAAVNARLHRLRSIGRRRNDAYLEKSVDLLRELITRREQEVLLLVGGGATSRQIADSLGISIRTVENHRTNLMNKLNASNAASLAQWAIVAKQL